MCLLVCRVTRQRSWCHQPHRRAASVWDWGAVACQPQPHLHPPPHPLQRLCLQCPWLRNKHRALIALQAGWNLRKRKLWQSQAFCLSQSLRLVLVIRPFLSVDFTRQSLTLKDIAGMLIVLSWITGLPSTAEVSPLSLNFIKFLLLHVYILFYSFSVTLHNECFFTLVSNVLALIVWMFKLPWLNDLI